LVQQALAMTNYDQFIHDFLLTETESHPAYWRLWHFRMDVDYWYSYVRQGLRNQIEGHSRKDQRTYQRKFCSFISRRNQYIDSHPEYFI